MRKLTKIVAPALIAAMALGVGLPAQAAPYGQNAGRHDGGRYDGGRHNAGRATPARNVNIRAEIATLNRDIDRAAARRTISKREATGLKRDVQQIQRLYTQYARNGLTTSEVRALDSRIDRIRLELRQERRDNDNRRR